LGKEGLVSGLEDLPREKAIFSVLDRDTIQNDPLASLKKATVERTTSESFSPTPNPDVLDPGPQTGSTKMSAVHGERAESEGRRLSSAPVKPLFSSLKPSRNTVYLYPEDLTKLRQLSGYASTEHGIRANDSIIVRAALSLIETDVRFLHARQGRRPIRPKANNSTALSDPWCCSN